MDTVWGDEMSRGVVRRAGDGVRPVFRVMWIAGVSAGVISVTTAWSQGAGGHRDVGRRGPEPGRHGPTSGERRRGEWF